MKINKTIFWNRRELKNNTFFIIFILSALSLNNVIYAGTQIGGSFSNSASKSVFVPTITPIFTETLRSVSITSFKANDEDREYHTHYPGKEPPINIWTIFPGPRSNVLVPTIVTSFIGFKSSNEIQFF